MIINARVSEYRSISGYAGDGTTPVFGDDVLVAPLPAELRDPSTFRASDLARSGSESARLLVFTTRALDAQKITPANGDRLVMNTLVPKRDAVTLDVASIRLIDGGRLPELVVPEVRAGVAPAGVGGAVDGGGA